MSFVYECLLHLIEFIYLNLSDLLFDGGSPGYRPDFTEMDDHFALEDFGEFDLIDLIPDLESSMSGEGDAQHIYS